MGPVPQGLPTHRLVRLTEPTNLSITGVPVRDRIEARGERFKRSVAVVACDLDQEGVAIVGNIDSGVPAPRVPNVSFDRFNQLLLPALGIALRLVS